MENENIDWENTESIFEEDDTYENINAPKWVDLSAPCDTESTDDEAWFCKPGCKHPKCAEDYLKSKHQSKAKLLRSMTISEILPFRDRTQREAKAKNGGKGSKSSQHLNEDNENRNPNLSSTPPLAAKSTNQKKLTKKSPVDEKTLLENLGESSAKSTRKQGLKSTFSARNLVAGREILSQITEFCAQMKKMARKGSKKGASDKTLGEVKERVREKERVPLLVIKERKSGEEICK
ncbi:hypothetical protein COLO4_28674 [Corchorus olitorius]|uniref:Uncharacterized protein n=1 Tax=Corchorus olitorius TaxID=93759 RepID=A0A1R3HIR4_9ROSI|nr:hypothetical protein COLO4_28674 [Corchorus olitorius]